MSSKKKKKEPEVEEEVVLPLMERPKFRLIYSIVVYTFFSAGVLLLILGYTDIWPSETAQQVATFTSFGVLGIGIVLLTMRSSRKHSAPQPEEEKDEDTLQMRTRR